MAWDDHLERADDTVREILGDSAVVYTPSVGSPVTVAGIFDPQHAHSSGPAPIDQATSWGPAVWLKLSDLPADPETTPPSSITIDSVSYTVRDATLKDGQGGVLILLNRSA